MGDPAAAAAVAAIKSLHVDDLLLNDESDAQTRLPFGDKDPSTNGKQRHSGHCYHPLLQLVFRPQIRFFEQQRQEHKLGVVLVAISVLFICCHAPSVSLNPIAA